jgi:DNA polymerase-3 subunit chi
LTQVFFYHGASDKIAAACALLSGAYAKKKPMLVYALEDAVASSVDRMLWTHSALSFVPHCRADSPLAGETPILITDKLDSIPQDKRLMNLSQEIPPGFSRFESLIEVVGQEDNERAAARDRVKFYKDRGYEVHYVDLSDR